MTWTRVDELNNFYARFDVGDYNEECDHILYTLQDRVNCDDRIVLTEQVIGQVNNLKNLYNAAYEDPESFEDVSAEISNTINEIASTVEPQAEDSDLDGLIQEIIKAVDNKAEEIEKELEAKPKKEVKKPKSKSKK